MITRFAPSPTGPLHLGHAYSAMLAYDMAMAAGGVFLLRIEDIDPSRARPEWEAQIYDDLNWLGLEWPEPVMRQSTRSDAYKCALTNLWEKGVLYPCTCSRSDIRNAMSAPQLGSAQLGPDGMIYPGTCKSRSGERQDDKNLRVNLELVRREVDRLSYVEVGQNAQSVKTKVENLLSTVGDFVVSRKQMFTSYHLSVVVDDAAQAITHVVRGADIQDATPIHVLLQKLLDLPTPTYHHHRLILDDSGKRLAKRDDARALSKYRTEGATPADIRHMVGLPPA